MRNFRPLFTRQSGHLLTEYTVMVALLSVAVISAFSFFSSNPQRPLVTKGHAVINEARSMEFDQTLITSEDILPKNFYTIPRKDNN